MITTPRRCSALQVITLCVHRLTTYNSQHYTHGTDPSRGTSFLYACAGRTATWRDLLCAHNMLVTTNGLVKRMLLGHDGIQPSCTDLCPAVALRAPHHSELVQTKWNELSSSHVLSNHKAPQMWNWCKIICRIGRASGMPSKLTPLTCDCLVAIGVAPDAPPDLSWVSSVSSSQRSS